MSETRLLAKEQPHHLRAFEHYYGLGEQRSYERRGRSGGRVASASATSRSPAMSPVER